MSDRKLWVTALLFNGLKDAVINSGDESPLATSPTEKIEQKSQYPDKHAPTAPANLSLMQEAPWKTRHSRGRELTKAHSVALGIWGC